MNTLCERALIVLIGGSAVFLPVEWINSGQPHLWVLLTYFLITFFCFGILFGNLNTLAISPLGHIAGVANSVISSVQSIGSALLGGVIGYLYNQSVTPLVLGFLFLGILSYIIIRNERLRKPNSQVS